MALYKYYIYCKYLVSGYTAWTIMPFNVIPFCEWLVQKSAR